MKFRTFVSSAAFAVGIFCASITSAATILETATLGATGNIGGPGFSGNRFVGAIFSLDEETRLTSIGAHLNGNGTFFAAVTSLPSVGLPNLSGGLTAIQNFDIYTEFNLSGSSQDIMVAIDEVTAIGRYALVIGAVGSSSGNVVTNGAQIGSPSYFNAYEPAPGYGIRTQDGTAQLRNARFSVQGSVPAVPLPAGLPLMLVGVAAFGLIRRRAS